MATFPRCRPGSGYGSSTPSSGNSRRNVGSHEDSFGLTPDSGRGRDAALRLTVDPNRTLHDDQSSRSLVFEESHIQRHIRLRATDTISTTVKETAVIGAAH